MENKKRRDFIKSMGLLGLASAITSPIRTIAGITEQDPSPKNDLTGRKSTTISILQTTDVHCQIHAHDELFWENNKAVFRKTGGYANLAAMLNNLKSKNPNTFTIDTGDRKSVV